jgi:small subunit ribosomal protein S21
MLILKRGEKESIDKLLKRFKRKVRETRLIKDIRKGKEFIKPSEKRRKQIQKATYLQKKKRLHNKD